MASSLLASLSSFTLNSVKGVASKVAIASKLNPFFIGSTSSIAQSIDVSSPDSLGFAPSRGYKSDTYRTVKRYTFGMGQLNLGRVAPRKHGNYEKDPRVRRPRAGTPFGHRVMFYEDRYVTDVGYRAEYYKGGPKPRFNDDEKKHMEKYMTLNAPFDEWDPKAAVFGQNDYIDILGDGNLSIRELNVDAPAYLRGWEFKGDKWEEKQFHHIMRRLHFEEDYLLNLRPTKWWQMRKELTRHARTCNRYRKRAHQRWPPN